jgi:hypothetical protein
MEETVTLSRSTYDEFVRNNKLIQELKQSSGGVFTVQVSRNTYGGFSDTGEYRYIGKDEVLSKLDEEKENANAEAEKYKRLYEQYCFSDMTFIERIKILFTRGRTH